jgi:hypothetical protein
MAYLFKGWGVGSDPILNFFAIHLCPNLLHDADCFLVVNSPRIRVLCDPTNIGCDEDSSESVVLGGAFREVFGRNGVSLLAGGHVNFDNVLDIISKVRGASMKMNVLEHAVLVSFFFPLRGLATATSRSVPCISS